MSRKSWFVMITFSIVFASMSTAYIVSAQSPAKSDGALFYSGRLTDPSGKPVADGSYDFIFTLYAAEKDDQTLWSEMQLGVSVKAGNVNVTLGQNVSISKDVSDRKELWLSVSVRGPQDTNFILLNPRRNLTAPDSASALTCPHSHFTDNWSGANSEWGVLLENTSTGDGLRAYSRSTVWNYAAIFGANIATTGYGTGVYGFSSKGVGVFANSDGGDALEATTTAPGKSAIYAHTTNSFGLTSRSTNNFAVQAGGGGDGDAGDFVGDLVLEGNRGELFTWGTVLNLFSNGWITFDLDNDNNGSHKLEVWNGTDNLVFSVDESGNTVATGVKSASVKTSDYGQRLLFTMESPEVWLEDFGSAKLVNGMITVEFEPIFAQTVNLTEDYHIFFTPLGDCSLYVAEKTPASFTVKAIGGQTCSIAFDYRIVAKRVGYENTRLAPDDLTNTSRSPATLP
jgi:hypothetical protein